jgi:hypothetical protein
MRMYLTLGLALLLAAPCFGGSLRKQCNKQCSHAISQCVLDHGGRQVAKCKARVRGQCRLQGIEVCVPPTTITTTSTTSTTTTLPNPFAAYAGRWEFTGFLNDNSCPVFLGGLRDDVTIRLVVGGGATGIVDSIPGVTFAGSFDPSNGNVMAMEADFTYTGSTGLSCPARGIFVFPPPPLTAPIAGGFGLALNCNGIGCAADWLGTWLPTS